MSPSEADVTAPDPETVVAGATAGAAGIVAHPDATTCRAEGPPSPTRAPSPAVVAPPLEPRLGDWSSYEDFGAALCASGVVTDPWLWGRPRFSAAPEVLPARLHRDLCRTAERVARAYHEICLACHETPELLETFFRMTPWQRAMFRASAPAWHGVARVDVFLTAEGPVITEMNSDTPTGQAEATVLSALASASHPGLLDPNRELGVRWLAMVEASRRRGGTESALRAAGLVYPTELTEDLALVRVLRRWLEAAGYSVVLGSPFNLEPGDAGKVLLFGRELDLLVRHYKTDWWGERESAWLDDDYVDKEPLAGPLGTVLAGNFSGRLTVVNPFGAVLPQNKRAMAYLWERIDGLPLEVQDTVRRHLPYTARLETLHEEQLQLQKDAWVLKSDYGAEGDEVVIGRHVTDDVWRRSLELARPGRWVAQRYFAALEDDAGAVGNYGVFVVAGRAAGIYLRRHRGATDESALSVPVLVEPG